MLTRAVGRPVFLTMLLFMVVAWIAGNTIAGRIGAAVDEPPFVYLEGVRTLTGVFLTVLILITQ